MSGGGSQTTAATPWSPAQPYLLDIMQQAQKQFGTTAGQFSDPASNFGYGQATGAVGDILSGANPYGSMASTLSPATTTAIQQQLSGTPDYAAVKGALDAANQQTWDSFNNQELPQLNQRASFLGNPSGAIKDLNWATANIGRNMDLNAQQQYLGLEEAAKARQANAMGLGAGIAQGAGAQQLTGANLYQSLAQMPQTNLADYAALIGESGGKFGTDTTKLNPGAGATAANVLGGLTAGAGLVNALFGGSPSTGGAVGAIGRLFGGSGAIDTAGLGSMAGSAASTAGSAAGAGMANTAADVAASNSAWLAGGGSGLGAGASSIGTGLAASEPALSTIGTGAVDAAADAAAANASGALGSGGAGAGGLGAGALAGGALAAAAVGLPIWAAFQHTTPPIQGLLNSMNDPNNPGLQALGRQWQAYYDQHDTLPPEAGQLFGYLNWGPTQHFTKPA